VDKLFSLPPQNRLPHRDVMKTALVVLSLLACATLTAFGGDGAAEKAFVDKFKTAFEANDKATLESLLYKEKAHPEALEFFKMMLLDGAGSKIAEIELVDLSPEELKRAEGTQKGPGGQVVKMPIKPTKKLVFKVDTSSGSGTGSATSKPMVAEKDGKFVIPVPVAAK
jgi:hypothetical protein